MGTITEALKRLCCKYIRSIIKLVIFALSWTILKEKVFITELTYGRPKDYFYPINFCYVTYIIFM